MNLFGKKKKTVQNNQEKQDWNKDLKRTNLANSIVEQQDFNFLESDYNNAIDTSRTKNGLSSDYVQISADQIKVLKKCNVENSANELMEILGRSHKSRFKKDILNPLLEYGFFKLTIPEKPKSSKQRYRHTGKFVNVIKML